MKRATIVIVISYLFIFLFTYAAGSKLMDYRMFRAQVGQSPLLTIFAGWVVWFIPVVETGIVILLAIPRLRLTGIYASFSLMVIFTTYIIIITRYSEYIPCSCGGILQHMTWDQHLLFNIFFVFLGLAGIGLYPDKQGTDSSVRV